MVYALGLGFWGLGGWGLGVGLGFRHPHASISNSLLHIIIGVLIQ